MESTTTTADTQSAGGKLARGRLHRLVIRRELRRTRKQMGLTQSEMAEYMGAGAKSYTRWENGAMPSRMTLNLIHALSELRAVGDVIKAVELYQLERTTENFTGVEKMMARYDSWRVKVG